MPRARLSSCAAVAPLEPPLLSNPTLAQTEETGRVNLVLVLMVPTTPAWNTIGLYEYAAMVGKKVVGLSPGAAERLVSYDWPGNVRELGNCLECAVSVAHFEEIQAEDLPDKMRSKRAPTLSGHDLPELLTLEEVERRHVLRVLEACNGNRTDAAKMLGLDRKTLYRKLLRWGVGD